MKRKIINVSVIAAAVLLLSGCGGSDGGTVAATTATTGTAFYVDSAVEGVTVTSGSTVSVTDANGKFTYEEGKPCDFSIGDIHLRTETGLYQDKVVIEDHIETAQFLQSMDYDGNAENGIRIHPDTADIMAKNNIDQMPNTDQDLADACADMENANIGYQGGFVHEQDAQDHMDRTKNEYDGKNDPHNEEDAH